MVSKNIKDIAIREYTDIRVVNTHLHYNFDVVVGRSYCMLKRFVEVILNMTSMTTIPFKN